MIIINKTRQSISSLFISKELLRVNLLIYSFVTTKNNQLKHWPTSRNLQSLNRLVVRPPDIANYLERGFILIQVSLA